MIGKSILHYRILQKLGEGGMGVVYLADDTRLERKVAIKFMPSNVENNEQDRVRFENEAKAAAALNHPNIATIHAIEQSGDEQFIVMEYIDGSELGHAIHSSKNVFPFDFGQSIKYALQIARALNVAHKNKIVHRDIKSSNIMITKAGQIKVMDFGLAKMEHQKNEDILKSTIGTAAYMSPEQSLGMEVDARSDIWSFGILFYEIITGKLPFNGEYEQALMFSIQHDDYQSANELRKDIPEIIDKIINKCLVKETADRYQKMEELLKDFDLLKKEQGSEMAFEDMQSRVSINNRLAVLPITNISRSPDDEYFADGMTEELISTLSKINELRIIARSSVMRYKTIAKTIKEIGQELNVGTVLQGSVRKSDTSLRVTIQLISTATEELLWSTDYNKGFKDIFEIQSDIAKSVANTMKLTLLEVDDSEREEVHTESEEAYHLYLKGRYFWNKRTESNLIQCIHFLEKAVEIDPQYAAAHAALADAYIIFGDYNYLSPAEAFSKALHEAQLALELNNDLAQAHCSLACIYAVFHYDFEKSEKEFKYAIRLNPAYATSFHWYAINCLVPLKRYDEAIIQINKALVIDPLSLIINTTAGLVYYFAGKYDKALEIYEATLELDQNFGVAHHFASWAYAQKGLKDKAVYSAKKAIKIFGSSPALMAELGCIYALCGEINEALMVYKQIKKEIDNDLLSAYAKYSIAAFHACLFKNDLAIEWLVKTFEEKSFRLIYLKTDPWFKNVIDNAQVKKMLTKIHLL